MLAVCLCAADLHFKFLNPAARQTAALAWGAGGWPPPAPQPNLPRVPLDVVVMVKSLCGLDAGAICPAGQLQQRGLSPASSFLPFVSVSWQTQVTGLIRQSRLRVSGALRTCPGGFTLPSHLVCLQERCKVIFILFSCCREVSSEPSPSTHPRDQLALSLWLLSPFPSREDTTGRGPVIRTPSSFIHPHLV